MAHLGLSPNRQALLQVAEAIEPLLRDVVFVGGQVAELLVTAPAATRVRPTDDIDVVVGATTVVEYRKIELRLEELGLRNDFDGPICRWRTNQGHKVDVMPVDGSIFGFATQWYPAAITHATPYSLSDEITILIPSAPVFLATKWDAFVDRGHDDYLGSHDLEDIITVVAGRPELGAELESTDPDIRVWLAARATEFLAHDLADYAIQGALPDAVTIPGLLDIVRATFDVMKEGMES